MFTLDELRAAHNVVRDAVAETPSRSWPLLAERLGTSVVVKHENHVPTGAFKARGGLTYMDRLKRERPKFDFSIRDVMEVLPLMTEKDAPVVQAVTQAVRDVFGKDPDYVISPGTYDQKHMARIGHLHDAIAYGPGILDLAHKPDEWVGIDDMVESATVMALGLARLLFANQSAESE